MGSKYFTDDELRCKCSCGQVKMDPVFLAKLDQLREMLGVPMVIDSGYRCENHPAEKAKDGTTTGAHVQGKAVDVKVCGAAATRLISAAHALGFAGFGVKQHGPMEGRYIHIDYASGSPAQPRPFMWSYT